MKSETNSTRNKLILTVGLVLMLIFTFQIVLADSSQKIALTSDDPTVQVTFDGEAYTIELVSASDNSATVKVTDSKGESVSKEIQENQSKAINDLNIKVEKAEETNLKLWADLIVEKVEKEETSQTNMNQSTSCTDSDGGRNYFTKGIVKSGDKSYTDSCTYCTGLCPDEGPCPTPSCGAVTEYYCENKEVKQETKVCDNNCNEGACDKEKDEPANSFTLTNDAPIKSVSVSGAPYTIELISASDTSATLRIINEQGNSQTKEINEGGSEIVLGLKIKVTEADETNLKLSATVSIEKAEVEDETEEDEPLLKLKLTGEKSIIGVNINGKTNIIQLISTSDTSATLRIINEQGNSQTKEINEGKLEAIKGVRIKVVNADESNLELSAEIIVYGASEEVELITPTEETGPIEIPKKEGVACGGCVLDKKCYPFGYRKNGQFCLDNQEFTAQLESGGKCENNFECGSNVCISGECVSEGLLKKILNWFKRAFGFG